MFIHFFFTAVVENDEKIVCVGVFLCDFLILSFLSKNIILALPVLFLESFLDLEGLKREG